MKNNLEDRIIEFAVEVMNLAEQLTNDIHNLYFKDQIARSASSAAMNYGEARGAESLKDFIHKMKIAEKELRETMISLKILRMRKGIPQPSVIDNVIKECDELISIFVASIRTAKRKSKFK